MLSFFLFTWVLSCHAYVHLEAFPKLQLAETSQCRQASNFLSVMTVLQAAIWGGFWGCGAPRERTNRILAKASEQDQSKGLLLAPSLDSPYGELKFAPPNPYFIDLRQMEANLYQILIKITNNKKTQNA